MMQIEIKEKEWSDNKYRPTTGGTSATVAIMSQMTPSQYENISVDGRTTGMVSENRHLTCLQRSRVIPNVPPQPTRRRNKPTSMMRSNTMSVMSQAMRLSVLVLALKRPHADSAGTHAARN